MPLNDTQKEIIDSIIQYYFDDLSPEAKKLDEQIQSLRAAFENSIDEKDEKNELYQLQKCIFFPEINLRRLEESNPDITFQDVQEYILDYATNKIQSAADKANLSLDWPKELFHAVLTSLEKYTKPFKSVPLQQESKESPWEIPRLPGRNYEIVTVLTGAPIPDFVLKVTINSNVIEREIVIPPPSFPILTLADEIRVRELIKKFAAFTAEDLACSITMNELIRLNVIDEVNIEYAHQEFKSLSNIQLLLTYQYYLNLILNEKEEGFIKIWDVNIRETIALINPAVINALEQNLFDIEKARQLYSSQIALLSHFYYSKLIFNKELSYELPEETCRALLSPAVTNLIIQGKIKLAEALEMSFSTSAVLSNEFYFNLLMKNKFDFNKIKSLSLGQELLLLTPSIIQQISDGSLKIEDILNLPNQHLRMIAENPLLTELINEKILTLSDLNRIAFNPMHRFWLRLNYSSLDEERAVLTQSLKIIKEKDQIKKLVKDFLVLADTNILNSDDFRYLLKFIDTCLLETFHRDRYELHRNHLMSSSTMKDRCEKNLQTRLQAILENKPQVLVNQSKDSITQIRSACKLIDINFKVVGERALLNSIENSYKGFHRVSVSKLIQHSRFWNFNLEKSWAQAFSIRLTRFLEGKRNTIDNKQDTEEWISTDLKTIPMIEKLSLDKFRYYLIEQLHHNLKLQLTEIHNLDAAETPSFYKKIYQKLDQIEDEVESLTDTDLRNKKLIYSFNEVATLARNELEKKATQPLEITSNSLSLEEKKPESTPTDAAASQIGLFSHRKNTDIKLSLASFCQYLSSLPKMLGVTEEKLGLDCKL